MKTRISQTVMRAVQRLVDAPEQTLSLVTARLSSDLLPKVSASPAPDHIVARLEGVFEALSELTFQPHVGAALELACETLQAELPSVAIAAGTYDINSDEIRIVAARGMEQDLLRGTTMPLGQCLAGRAVEQACIVSGRPGAADWLGTGDEGAEVLLCPIMHDRCLLGVLAVADSLCTATFSEHDLELVSYVADQLASFIQATRQRPSIAAPVARGA